MVVKMGKIGIFHGYLGFTEGTYFLRWISQFCGFLWVSIEGEGGDLWWLLETYFGEIWMFRTDMAIEPVHP